MQASFKYSNRIIYSLHVYILLLASQNYRIRIDSNIESAKLRIALSWYHKLASVPLPVPGEWFLQRLTLSPTD